MINSILIFLVGFIIALFYSKGKDNPPQQAWIDTKRISGNIWRKLRELFCKEPPKQKRPNDVIDL